MQETVLRKAERTGKIMADMTDEEKSPGGYKETSSRS
jgi:hypothetical protein